MLLAFKSVWRDVAQGTIRWFGPQSFPCHLATICLSWVFFKWIVLTCRVLLSLLNKFANSFKPYHTHRALRNRQYQNQFIIGHYLIKLDLISDSPYLVSEFQRNEKIDLEKIMKLETIRWRVSLIKYLLEIQNSVRFGKIREMQEKKHRNYPKTGTECFFISSEFIRRGQGSSWTEWSNLTEFKWSSGTINVNSKRYQNIAKKRINNSAI